MKIGKGTGVEQWDASGNLKPDLNNFLHTHSPGNMTLDEFDQVSCDIYDEIIKAFDQWVQKKNNPMRNCGDS